MQSYDRVMINNSIAIETLFYSISAWQAVLKVNVISREEAGGRSGDTGLMVRDHWHGHC